VKLLRLKKGGFVFFLEKREKQQLLALLHRYPLVPSAHQSLSKSAAAAHQNEANQRLLDEALAEQREENKKQFQQLLKDKNRFHPTEDGWHMTLSGPDIEWLLQVLNELRVGNWLALGAPEHDVWDFELSQENAPCAWAMEMAGYFQVQLLEALHGEAL